MELSLKVLDAACDDIAERWSDATNRRFMETYVAPVAPELKVLLDAVQRLAEVLANAERACRDEE
jgi:hypothetical protein